MFFNSVSKLRNVQLTKVDQKNKTIFAACWSSFPCTPDWGEWTVSDIWWYQRHRLRKVKQINFELSDSFEENQHPDLHCHLVGQNFGNIIHRLFLPTGLFKFHQHIVVNIYLLIVSITEQNFSSVVTYQLGFAILDWSRRGICSALSSSRIHLSSRVEVSSFVFPLFLPQFTVVAPKMCKYIQWWSTS